MTILASEVQFYLPEEVSDDATNGGRMSATRTQSGAVNGVWPDVLKSLRLAGSTSFLGGPRYRKLFLKVANDADESLLMAELWNDIVTAGEDTIYMFAGTQRDTQDDITGSERIYGAAKLSTPITAGGSTIVVDVEDATFVGMFADGDLIKLKDDTNSEDLTIDGDPVVSETTKVTITVLETIANDYAITADDVDTGSRVCSVLEHGTVACAVDNWVESAVVDGTYDETTYPLTMDNIGTVEQTWTLTFSSATEFEVVGDTLGSVGTGDTSTDFTPINEDWTKPYFTLDADGWAGTWQANDTVVYQTHPAAIPFWLAEHVPVSCAPLPAGAKNNTKWAGEYV